jgi:two-component system sensor histidine kinase KdpD
MTPPQARRSLPAGMEFARRNLAPVLVALALTAAMTVGLAALTSAVKLDHVSIVYLIPVLIAAVRWGVVPAMVAALAGIAASAFFFYPPIFDFRVSDPQQVIDLVLFLIVAVVTSHLAVSLRSREDELRMRREAETFRDALIGSVSHELRTPLSSIVGSTYLLANAPCVKQDARLVALADDARQEAERLNDDIQNLLDASRITNAGIQPKLQWAEVSDIINAAVERKQHRLSVHPIEVNVAENLPLVRVDPALIEQVLGQVLDNAAKYSPVGAPITIVAAANPQQVSITVTDRGAGLTDEDRTRIWERFYRSPRHQSATPGSGLGLWVARAFVLASGGSIEATSSGPAQGTAMTIRLPMPAPATVDELVSSDE